MKSLPAIVTVCIVFAIVGSNARLYDQDDDFYSANDNTYQDSYENGHGSSYDHSGQSDWSKATGDDRANSGSGVTAQLDINRKYGESEEKYLTRISAQRAYETVQEYETRMEIFKVLLPELNIYDNNRYYDYWSKKDDSVEPEVKQIYLNGIDRRSRETNDMYYKRIFLRHDDESIDEYIRRICLMRTKYPMLSVWSGSAFTKYVKPNLVGDRKDSVVYNMLAPPSGSYISFGNSVDKKFPVVSNSYGNTRFPSLSEVPSYPGPSSNGATLTVSAGGGTPSLSLSTNYVTGSQQGTPKTNSFYSAQMNTLNPDWNGNSKMFIQLDTNCMLQEGESNEQYCKRLLQSDVPLSKKEYRRRIKHLKHSCNKKSRKLPEKLCKPHHVANNQVVMYTPYTPQQTPGTQWQQYYDGQRDSDSVYSRPLTGYGL